MTLQETAQAWADRQQAYRDARTAEDAAKVHRETEERTLEDLTRELRSHLGANMPRRVFNVGEGKLVMVSVERGVEVLEIEHVDG